MDIIGRDIIPFLTKYCSARSKMVLKARKCGILLNKERAALESAVKDYFNQKFSGFADGYQEHAIAKIAMMTGLFCVCYRSFNTPACYIVCIKLNKFNECDYYVELLQNCIQAAW